MPANVALPLPVLVEWCHLLRHNLDAGLPLTRVIDQLAARGPQSGRAAAERIGLLLRQGESLTRALEDQPKATPVLFRSLVRVGEETGHLPEILGELQRHYRLVLEQKRQFRSRCFLPVVQLVLGAFVIAALILVLGLIGGPAAPGIFGLRGPGGAAIFLGICAGIGAMVWALVRYAPAAFGTSGSRFARWVPGLGPLLECLVLGRFSLAASLTLGSGMNAARALQLALEATDEPRFAAAAKGVSRAIRNGDSLALALAKSGLFPETFLEIMAVAEEAGLVPERLAHQAEQFAEESSLRLVALTRMASLGVWLLYAAIMVLLIFRVAGFYLGALGI